MKSGTALIIGVGVMVAAVGVIGAKVLSDRYSKSHSALVDSLYASPQSMTHTVTNQWFSSLYFTPWSQPFFAYPLAFQLTEKGLGISYPRIKGTEKTVFGSYTPDLNIQVGNGLTSKQVLSADPASVSVKLCSSGMCATTRFIHGSPTLFLTTQTALMISITAPTKTGSSAYEQGIEYQFVHGNYEVAILRDGNFISLTTDPKADTQQFTLQKNDQLLVGLQPAGVHLHLTDMSTEIIGTDFSYQRTGDTLQTNLQYLTKMSANGHAPLVALLPHQWASSTQPNLGTYQTVRGTLKLYQTDQITQKLPTPKIYQISQMVSTLTPTEKNKLITLVDQSTSKILTETPIPVVYDAGKQVFRIAQMYQIAQAVQSTSAAQLKEKTMSLLDPWLSSEPSSTNSLLKYSDEPKGVIAKNPQYGNELFNDHHFHYGYFLSAAGILLHDDSSLYSRFQMGITALLHDVANTQVDNSFPYLRAFDPYESHSWADGRALAADGNNQESTSEAINRWYGIYLIGDALQKNELTTLGLTGLAMEQQGAQVYWLNQRPDIFAFPPEFLHPMASLIWGGKYDFATWFSDKPTHIFGIQFLPMTPAMSHITDANMWAKFQDYKPVPDQNGWNDIYSMVAAANGKTVPDQLPQYEAGNSAAFYYLWVNFWKHQNHG